MILDDWISYVMIFVMFLYDNNSITKDEETQFRSITVSLALSNDLDYNVKVVSFINELLFNSIALEERVPIREKFIKVAYSS